MVDHNVQVASWIEHAHAFFMNNTSMAKAQAAVSRAQQAVSTALAGGWWWHGHGGCWMCSKSVASIQVSFDDQHNLPCACTSTAACVCLPKSCWATVLCRAAAAAAHPWMAGMQQTNFVCCNI